MGSGVTKEQIQAYEAWERSYKDKEGSLEKRREALENVKRLHNEKAEELHQHEAELKAEQDTLKKAELSEKTAEQKLQKDRAALEEDRKRLEEKVIQSCAKSTFMRRKRGRLCRTKPKNSKSASSGTSDGRRRSGG